MTIVRAALINQSITRRIPAVRRKQIAFREVSDRYAIMPKRQVGRQCLVTQSRLPYDSIVPRPCTMNVTRCSLLLREKDGLDDVCLPFGNQSSPAGVYTCRQSQKGTRSLRANDCALPARVSRVTGAWVARGETFSVSSAPVYPVRGRDTWVSAHLLLFVCTRLTCRSATYFPDEFVMDAEKI